LNLELLKLITKKSKHFKQIQKKKISPLFQSKLKKIDLNFFNLLMKKEQDKSLE